MRFKELLIALIIQYSSFKLKQPSFVSQPFTLKAQAFAVNYTKK